MKLATGGDIRRRLVRRNAETTTASTEDEEGGEGGEVTEDSAGAVEITTSVTESETVADWSTQR